MGILMSLMGGGLPSSQLLSFVFGTVYKQFIEREINNFDDFHVAILDIFNSFNSALPGKHYDAPSLKEVEAIYKDWKEAKEPEKKKNIFLDFMKKNVNPSKVDDATMITGIVTPPVAMAAKRAGQNVPQLKIIKSIPDVLFVPSMTVMTLMSVKISRRIIMGKIAS
ncbi:hypothetical protein FNV43_RR18376 [Rhamnella rubrinervis]|uniref:Calcium ion-binding protein n=1 Tax=Rhamnella rubrinervis TaxID=2594499 RepID=A0A8K0GWE2_9ROSA|nr:hypothetical protein FNV43_RR17652 [Rhamnella rubrinervis]KAF3440098.1 hypothetical protein FNV43_RR18376 [Rhamnella rubrinervis]